MFVKPIPRLVKTVPRLVKTVPRLVLFGIRLVYSRLRGSLFLIRIRSACLGHCRLCIAFGRFIGQPYFLIKIAFHKKYFIPLCRTIEFGKDGLCEAFCVGNPRRAMCSRAMKTVRRWA